MYNDVTVNPGVDSGLDRDTPLTDAMKKLAKRRNKITDDVQAAFKEGERAPVAGASL